MAFTRNTWVSPEGSFLNRFTKASETTTSVELTHDPVFTNNPTPFTAAWMNNLETALDDLYNNGAEIDSLFIGAADNGYGSALQVHRTVSVIGVNNDDDYPAELVLGENGTVGEVGFKWKYLTDSNILRLYSTDGTGEFEFTALTFTRGSSPDLEINGRFKAQKGRTTTGTLQSNSTTLGSVFTTLSAILANVGDTCIVSGCIDEIAVAYAARNSSIAITFYGKNPAGSAVSALIATSGSSTPAIASIAW